MHPVLHALLDLGLSLLMLPFIVLPLIVLPINVSHCVGSQRPDPTQCVMQPTPQDKADGRRMADCS